AQLNVVEDFAIEGNPETPIPVAHRLLAAGHINNAEAGIGQAGFGAAVKPGLVGTSMANRSDHLGQQLGVVDAVQVYKAADPTHSESPRAKPLRRSRASAVLA